MQRSLSASLVSTLSLVLLGFAWLVLAPTQLGGPLSYLFIVGNSMEPGFHTGDLAIVRQADEYPIGGVVAYQHPDLGVVIHRLIGRDGNGYVFKGDHNDFIDPYHPVHDELLGTLWLHAPSVGSGLQWLQSALGQPLVQGGLVTMAGLYVLTDGQQHDRARRRAQRQRWRRHELGV